MLGWGENRDLPEVETGLSTVDSRCNDGRSSAAMIESSLIGSDETRLIAGRIISNSASCTCTVSGWLSKSKIGVAGPVLGEGVCVSMDDSLAVCLILKCDKDSFDLIELDLCTGDVADELVTAPGGGDTTERISLVVDDA